MVDAPRPHEGNAPQPENLKPQYEPTIDASRIIRHSFLYEAKQVALSGKNKQARERVENMGMSAEKKTTLGWIAFFDNLAEGDMYVKPEDIRANSDGTESDRDTYIRVWEENGERQAEPSLKSAEMPDGSQNLRVTHILGRKDGQFHCKVDGSETLITVPEHIIMTSFICSQSESLLAKMPLAQRQIFETYLKQIQKPAEPVNFDQKMMKEAAKESGQITTDAIIRFLEQRYPQREIPPDLPEDASEEDIKKHNDLVAEIAEHNRRVDAKVGSFRESLKDHVIASRGDIVELMRIHGPDAMDESKKALAELKNNESFLRQQFAQLRGTSEGEVIEQELAGLRSEITQMEQALETYNNPETAAQVLLMAQEGDLPPSLSKSINYFLNQGKLNEAMLAAVDEQIRSLPDDSAERAQLEKRKQIAMMAGGGVLLLLFMLITQGMNANK